ncbi:MAG TPA: GMC family oxidoreductase N-terminal domain-containing protein [Steroidobacteraceae bacterium]|nr:GMC family oxidoreductase N-terminal domain-containing protein [Steroidobacteraceae bacterium]
MAAFAETFDYLVVGAGTAGCVLAARLSEKPDARVCLIEAGAPDRHPFIHVPAAVAAAIGTRSLNWGFLTVPQPHLNGRRIPLPRGRVVGGSGSINGMVYFRGQPRDFDDWAAAGNPGWSYREVLPYFIRSESNANYPGSPYHGTSGPMRVTHIRRPNPLNEAFLAAMATLKFKRSEDFNGADPEGYGPRQATIRDGRRESTASAYLRPARRRSNLKVLTGALVQRVLIDSGRAVGVEVRLGGDVRHLGARAEVVVSGGSILSPQILMLSGIGAGAALRQAGVEVKLDLPAVGANYHDHLAAAVLMEMRNSTSYGISLRALPRGLWNVLEYALLRQGPFASNVFEANAFVRTRAELDRPDIQIVFQPARRNPHPFPLPIGHGFAVSVVNLYPRSRGRLTLASADPRVPPAIDPNLLGVPEDLDPLVRGLELARRIAAAPSFARYRAVEVAPGPAVQGEAGLGEYVRRSATTVHHPVSTCRMGPGTDCVVDPQLRVRGLEGLRVADASIFPSIVGGNTNAAVVMIAEKASDMILGRPAPRPLELTGAVSRVAAPSAA